MSECNSNSSSTCSITSSSSNSSSSSSSSGSRSPGPVIVPQMDNPPQLEWPTSTTPCTLRHFLHTYESSLPQIIRIVHPATGTAANQMATDEVLFVHSVRSKKRVVVKDKKGKHYSIPMKLAKVMKVKKNKTVLEQTVKSVLSSPDWQQQQQQQQQHGGSSDNSSPYTVSFIDNTHVRFCQRSASDSSISKAVQFGELQLVDCYREKCLVANSILTKGSMMRQVLVIPVYLPITISVAQGIRDGDCKDWGKWRAFYNNVVSKVDSRQYPCNEDIFMLPSSASNIKDSAGYVFLEPRSYIQCIETVPELPPKPHARRSSNASSTVDGNPGENFYANSPTMRRRDYAASSNTTAAPHTYVNQPATPHTPPVRHAPLPHTPPGSGTTHNNTSTLEASCQSKKAPPPIEMPPPTPPKTPPKSSGFSSGYNVFVFPPTSRSPQEEELVYQTLRSFPTDRTQMSINDVERALRALSLDVYVPVFRQHTIDGQMLVDLSATMLQESFGFSIFESMKLLKFANGWVPKS